MTSLKSSLLLDSRFPLQRKKNSFNVSAQFLSIATESTTIRFSNAITTFHSGSFTSSSSSMQIVPPNFPFLALRSSISARSSFVHRGVHSTRSSIWAEHQRRGIKFSTVSNVSLTASSSPTVSTTLRRDIHNESKLNKLSENFLDGTSSVYIEQMYRSWKHDPSSVHSSWASFFSNIEAGIPPGSAFQQPPTFSQLSDVTSIPSENISRAISESMRILLLIRAYQVRGHAIANLDPLGLLKIPILPELELASYGFTEADLDREFTFGDSTITGFLGGRSKAFLRDIVHRLRETYCSSIGFEYMHIQNRERCNWLRERIETPEKHRFSNSEKKIILERLMWATEFELFISKKWGVAKRFGVDGCESLIPGMKALFDQASDVGIESAVMGMAHRGRLNVLANVLRKPLEAIFHEFSGGTPLESKTETGYIGSGDVKYHLGTSYDRLTRNGKKIRLSLLANPSHLEAVNPIVEGKVRARQYTLNDDQHEKVMSLIIHGDASVAAQGIVYETIDLSGLSNYTTGGTVHIVINNQIGFTTDPKSSRANTYCTDVAKVSDAPIFHVNGDDPEAVVYACRLAAEWRQRFHNDVVVDIICYRKFGHNEGDEPRFTQPLMYKQIDKQEPTMSSYQKRLMKEKVITQEEIDALFHTIRTTLEKAHANAEKYQPQNSDWLESCWKELLHPPKDHPLLQKRSLYKTSSTMETLQKVGKALYTVPEDFHLHPGVRRLLQERKAMMTSGEGVNWGMAEALAVGSLLLEGYHVRLSGQDVERGTFSHRHAVLHDQESGAVYRPLDHLAESNHFVSGGDRPYRTLFTVTNSSLSEFGVLGFELGYALENPNFLVIWEAQFGDFANGAQVIIDQFISSGEAKWKTQNGIVLLLPHGFDGGGPEHSSARLERYLQLCDSDPDQIPPGPLATTAGDVNDVIRMEYLIQHSNWQVVNVSTAANFFHVLRRQLHRDFRKPLIVMSPKSLLRLKSASSRLTEFIDGSKFELLYPEIDKETLVTDAKITRLVFCSGKIYYDLLEERSKRKVKEIALIRIEQLYPFPFEKVIEQANKYANAEIIWCQEEPKNMGAWSFMAAHLRTALKPTRGTSFFPRYIGRPSAASPATGYFSEHVSQWLAIANDLFGNKK